MVQSNALQGHVPLYDKLEALHGDLAQIEDAVKNNEKQFFTLIKELDQRVIALQSASTGNEPLQLFYAQRLNDISQIVQGWVKRVEEYELNTSFRKHYGDSLLIYVYGKVKAGKSSLGNFIAYGQEKPSTQWREQLKNEGHHPTFFVADKGKRSDEDTSHQRGFYVDSAEATSCIQGFTLPGLTWIDSPGIHSVTQENQSLAQKYVDSADLIIYPMNSAQPGRRTDMLEIRDLILKRKRLLLLITRCDEQDSDEDDEGNIVTVYQMKSDRNRSMQAEYVSKEFVTLCEELNVQDIDFEVLTISVRYSASLGNTPDAFKASGVQALMEKLIKTISSEGVTLKKNVPQNALQAFYRFLLSSREEKSSIDALHSSLSQLREKVLDMQNDLDRQCEQLKITISNTLALKIAPLVEDYTQHRNSRRLERRILAAVRKELESKLSPVINEITQSLTVDINSMVSALDLKNHISLESVHQTISIDTTGRNEAIGGGIGAALVGGVAFFFSGGLAAMAGSVVGQQVGQYLGGLVKTSRTALIDLGDNRQALTERLSEMAAETIESTIEKTRFEVNKYLLNPMLRTESELSEQTTKIRSWAMEYQQKEW